MVARDPLVQAGPGRCSAHEDMIVRVNLVEQEQETMNTRLQAVEAKVYSPSVMVAVLGLIGTAVTAAGTILGVIAVALLKSHGVI
jgi:hypothetical protein